MNHSPVGVRFQVPGALADFRCSHWNDHTQSGWCFSLYQSNSRFEVRTPEGNVYSFEDGGFDARVLDVDDYDPASLADAIFRRLEVISGKTAPMWVSQFARREILNWIVDSRANAVGR